MFRIKQCLYRGIFLSFLLSSMTFFSHAAYHVGDKGEDVVTIQKSLNGQGFKVSPSGIYTKETQNAVKSFQKKYHLAVDGIVGPQTYKALVGKPLVVDTLGGTTRKTLLFAKDGENSVTDTNAVPSDMSFPLSNMPQDAKKLISYAVKYRGTPYQFGGTTTKGFDCSGYTSFVFHNAAGIDLPRSADQQYKVGKAVKRSNLQPGDLVFFETYTKGVSHSGIYIGNNKFISATSSRGVIEADMSSGYWFDHYVGAKRILK